MSHSDFAVTLPTSDHARRIATDTFGEPVTACTRFTTGLRHWVYDVVLQSGANVVVRLGHPDHRAEIAGGVFWHEQLANAGIPIANVLTHAVDAAQPYMILERLPGSDLGNVFDELSAGDLDRIAESVATMQRRAGALRSAGGFGYALNYQTALRDSWHAVLDHSIERSEAMIRAAGVVSPDWVERVRTMIKGSTIAFDGVQPTAFLHDATTKNVIVAEGQVSGIVDVDEMAFGDPLWAPALTKMSLLSARRHGRYADRYAELVATDDAWEPRLALYCAIFCLGFLAEIGQRFNQEQAAPVDEEHRTHLEFVMQQLLGG